MSRSFLTILVALLAFLTACEESVQQSDKDQAISEETIESLTAKIEAGGLSPRIFFERSKLYFAIGELQASADDILKAISLDSTRVEFYHHLSDIQLNALQSGNALKSLEQAVRLDPANRVSLLKLLELQILLRQYVPAVGTSQRLLVLDPQDSEAFFLRGILFKEQGMDSLAIVNFQRSVDINSDMTEAFIMLGDLHEKSGSEFAGGYYANAVRADSNDMNALFSLAFYQQNHGQEGQALGIYKRMILLDRTFVPAYVNGGILFLAQDSVAQAQSWLREGLSMDSSFVLTHYYLGQCAEKMGLPEQARKHYENALEIDPDYSDARRALGTL